MPGRSRANPTVITAILASAERVRLSDRTLIDLDALCHRLAEVRTRGYAISDGENAYGLRTVAAPVLGPSGAPHGAVSLTARQDKHGLEAFISRSVPPLLEVSGALSPRGSPHRVRRMTTLRLLADDLTGALDTAAEFIGLTGPVHAFWQGAQPRTLPANAAIDLGTREADEATARAVTTGAAPALRHAGIAYKKIDSLLRGQTLPELAACFATEHWTHAILAPAFPFQGRITRGGQQFAANGDQWRPVGPNLVDALRALGVPAQLGATPNPGITVFDAETDDDLAGVAAAATGAVLWCGTGGLAGALARSAPPALPPLPRPVLGLFGSDQAVTAGQLAACGLHWTALPDGSPASAGTLARQLHRHGIALASLDLPSGLSRAAAARRIDRELHALCARLPRPGTLIVAGGETLRGLCQALGADSLLVQGRIMPGIPVSTLCGGVWDGVTIVSKSGAFGHPTLLREMLRLADLERTAS